MEKWFIKNADPLVVCKTPEENDKSKTLLKTSKLIYIVIMP
jgi:hypothetical protein